ncbi:unnamed protein product [Closterium sp. NIES-53]
METLSMSAEERMQLNAARLGRAMLRRNDDVDDVDENGDGDAEDAAGGPHSRRRGLKDGGRGKQLGLNPPPLNSGPSMADVNGTFFRYDSVVPNATVDWRLTKYISPIQRQFQCASCWVIAAVDSISMMWAITNRGTPLVLSPQQVCDCATKQCCQGGWPDWAYSYVLFNGGLQSVDDYSYIAQDNQLCSINASVPNAAQITGWELVPPYNAMALMKAVSMQPVVAFLSGSSKDFQMYSSRDMVKIYDGLCTTDINHAVVVVGYNYLGTTNGSYWIIKNSWFETWGDDGYMYLAMSPDIRGKCGLHAIPAMYPVYYPFGPQPVKISNGPVNRKDDGDDGKWWNKAFTINSDACQKLINPCGRGTCYTKNGIARCDCSGLTNFVEVLGVPTAKCVPRFPCNRTNINPCGAGSCSNPGDGSYACSCPVGYAIGAASDGTQTCVGVATTSTSTITYTTVPGDSCSVVAAAFGITTTTLSLLNPFLNCSLLYIPPGFAITVSNTSTSSSPICTATYIVTPADNCTSLANTFFAGSLANLQKANPLVCTTGRPVYPSQAICTSVTTAGTSVTVPQCGQTYSSVAGDTCSSVATKYLISLATFTGLNPGLSCTGSLPIGSYLCVASKTVQTTVNCTATYTVLQGDNCPNIWNAANLTEQTFLAINPGIRCQAPYLQLGQKVCISSPILTTLVASSNTSYSLYKVKDGDTLALISSSFVNRCIPASVSPASIAAENNILETAALVVGMNLIIPCDSRVGIIDCGCAISLPVCGADYVTYPSYCDAWGLHLGIEKHYNAWKIFDVHSKETVAARGFRGNRAFASAADKADSVKQNVDGASEKAGPLPYCSVNIPMDNDNPRESVNAETYFDFAETGYVTPQPVDTNVSERIGPNFLPDPKARDEAAYPEDANLPRYTQSGLQILGLVTAVHGEAPPKEPIDPI